MTMENNDTKKRNQSIRLIQKAFFAAFLLSALLLSGCSIAYSTIGGQGAATPERAAMDAVVRNQGGGLVVDQTTVHVLQTQQLQENFALVQVAFQGVRNGRDQEQCLGTQGTVRTSRGDWVTSGGGSGCAPVGQTSGQPLDFGQGSNSAGGIPGDPGYTEVNGLIFDPAILAVRVTWEDGQVQQASVANGAYLAARVGEGHRFTLIEALDESGDVVYTYPAPNPAPGKQ